MHLLDNMPIRKAIQLLSTFHRQGARVEREKMKSLWQLRDQHLQLNPQSSAFFYTYTCVIPPPPPTAVNIRTIKYKYMWVFSIFVSSDSKNRL